FLLLSREAASDLRWPPLVLAWIIGLPEFLVATPSHENGSVTPWLTSTSSESVLHPPSRTLPPPPSQGPRQVLSTSPCRSTPTLRERAGLVRPAPLQPDCGFSPAAFRPVPLLRPTAW